MAKKIPNKRGGAGTKKSAEASPPAVPSSEGGPARAIRNRVKELRFELAANLRANPKNWRTHSTKQAGALVGVLQEIGIADALIARELADGSLELIDGHLRKDVLAHEKVPVLVLDVTEAEAQKLLVTLDPLAEMADANKDALEILLREVQTGEQALAEMFTDLAKEHKIVSFVAGEAQEPEPPAAKEFGVIVICADEEEQRSVFEKLQADGYECKVIVT